MIPLLLQTHDWRPNFRSSYVRIAREAGLDDLAKDRSTTRREIRLWDGFGVTNLTGIVLRRVGGTWVREAIRGGFPDGSLKTVRRRFDHPSPSWVADLLHQGPLGLPDGESLPGRVMALDGFSYVLETRWNGVYRTRLYSHYDLAKEPEDARMRAIAATLRRGSDPVFRSIVREHPYRDPKRPRRP